MSDAASVTRSATVIVVCFNGLRDMRRCLPALLAQDHPDYEVLVVDNASTDGSREFVESVQEGHARLRLVENASNLGYAGGNNVGFDDSSAEFLVVLNPDTEPRPDWLSELLGAFDDPTVGLATSKLLLMDDPARLNTCGNDVSLLTFAVCRGLGEPADSCAALEDVGAVSGAAFAVRRSVLDRIGPFDPSFFMYYEDTDLSMRARLAGYRCVCVPTSVAAHDYVFRFPPRKAFLQERNRYHSLLKVFRWRTLVLLGPALALAEFVSLGYCVTRGPGHVWGKVRAYAWVLAHLPQILRGRRATQATRVAKDAELIAAMVPEIRAGDAGGAWLGRVVASCLRPLLRFGHALLRRLPW